jgi:hypothetical protein
MKSPSHEQNSNTNTNTNTNPATLRNSLLQAWSRDAISPVFPITRTNPSPESRAVQREKLLVILDAAIALVDDDDFDFDPDETPQSHFGALGWRGPRGDDGDSRA